MTQFGDDLGETAVEHDGNDVGVVPDVNQLIWRVPIVGVDRCQSGLERGVDALEILRAVVHVLSDLVLMDDAGVEQGGEATRADL